MTIQITAIRLSGPNHHESITQLWWTNTETGHPGTSTRADVVTWLEEDTTNTAFVRDANGNNARVGVITPSIGPRFLRTYADGKWTDNLLALPQQ